MVNNDFEVKSGLMSVKSLIIKESNLKELENYINRSVIQAPFMFKFSPFFVDLEEIKHKDFEDLLEIYKNAASIFKKYEIFPMGIKNCKKSQKESFNKSGILVFIDIQGQPKSNIESNKEINQPIKIPEAKEKIIEKVIEKVIEGSSDSFMIYEGVIRGGQQVYAANKDLIIFGHVNNGAEVIAGRNLIIFGSAEGRLIAGADSNNSTIIAGKFKPSLVSISGNFKTIEESDSMYGRSNVKISFKNDKFEINEMAI